MTGRADRWIRRTTIGSVSMLAVIAGTVSYLHMHELVALHGQPGWVAALTPLSVDGMIVAASTTLLADSRSGGRGGLLPWALLAVGSLPRTVRGLPSMGYFDSGRFFMAERGGAESHISTQGCARHRCDTLGCWSTHTTSRDDFC